MWAALDGLATFNLIESVVWFAFGVALLVAAIRKPTGYRYGVAAGVAFLLFGGSDLIEIRTGAWYRPWWLLAWKAACVVGLAASYWRYRALLRSDTPPEDPRDA